MRVFLIQTAKGLFSSSGGYKANNALLRYLASRGHCVRQLCYSYRGEVKSYIESSNEVDTRFRTRVLHMGSQSDKPGHDVQVHELCMEDGVETLALNSEAFDAAFGGKVESPNQLARMSAEYIEVTKKRNVLGTAHGFISFLQEEIRRFCPTHIISNDGLSMKASLAPELAQLTMYRIAVVHTAEQLPFGPFAGGLPGHSSTAREADLFQQLDGIWSVSETIRRYAPEHGHLETRFLVHHPWTYMVGEDHVIPDRVYNWDKKFVGMINPCPVKGARILVDLARKCPQLEFLTYMSWGADDATLQEINGLSNMTVRPCCAVEKDLWRDIKVLVVPSLWCEAWGMVVVEAHLRGIPVVSSNAGALSESMLGLDYIIPVTPITGERDASGRYTIPEQDVAPWVTVVTKLMRDRSEYERVSVTVRDTTIKWLKGNSEADIETWLMGMRTGSKI